MTILRGHAHEWPGPEKNDRCALCRGPLHFPILEWSPQYRGDDDYYDYRSKYICKECCADIHSGLIRDLREMKALQELRQLGFHKARPTRDGDVFVPPENSQH
jgi:hypothetical protein